METNYLKLEIPTTTTAEDFKRGVWIALAREDAPLDVFKQDIGEIKTDNYEVFVSSDNVDITYQGSVGYNREEPYIAYETYYEDEPYITTETYYDKNTQRNETRQVTKYKKVQRQRQVTKYKTVTDWSPHQGTHSESHMSASENREHVYLNEKEFLDRSCDVDSDNYIPVEDDAFFVSEYARAKVRDENISAVEMSARLGTPGDKYKDFSARVESVVNNYEMLFKANGYTSTIKYKGKEYVKNAFAFGELKVKGDKIKNDISLSKEAKKMLDEAEKKKEERLNAVEGNVWKKIMPFTLATYAVMALSILLSLLVRSTPLVIILAVASLAIHIFSIVFNKKETQKENEKARLENAEYTEKVTHEVENYARVHCAKVLSALNGKLNELGLKPASEEELGIGKRYT